MRLALRDGDGRYAPRWMATLQMAEEWGMYPEDIETRRGSLKWAARWAAYRNAVRWVQENNT